MGCDIHGPWVFCRTSPLDPAAMPSYGSYTQFCAMFDWDRDYTLFALMAGVRNDDVGIKPIASTPRGFPLDYLEHQQYRLGINDDPDPECPASHDCHGARADCHSMSWLTTNELVEVQRRYRAKEGCINDDVADAIMYMRKKEERIETAGKFAADVRIVFCFDN